MTKIANKYGQFPKIPDTTGAIIQKLAWGIQKRPWGIQKLKNGSLTRPRHLYVQFVYVSGFFLYASGFFFVQLPLSYLAFWEIDGICLLILSSIAFLLFFFVCLRTPGSWVKIHIVFSSWGALLSKPLPGTVHKERACIVEPFLQKQEFKTQTHNMGRSNVYTYTEWLLRSINTVRRQINNWFKNRKQLIQTIKTTNTNS